jgi:hypothetical protein
MYDRKKVILAIAQYGVKSYKMMNERTIENKREGEKKREQERENSH